MASVDQKIAGRATLHLMVGLPGSGKTTRARQLEEDTGAIRFTPDEWQLRLFGDETDDPRHDARHTEIEQIMWQLAEKLLQRGVSVILDYGFWAEEERLHFCSRASALGADFVVHFMDVPLAELLRRIALRNQREEEPSFTIHPHHMEEWSAFFQPVTAEEREKYAKILNRG